MFCDRHGVFGRKNRVTAVQWAQRKKAVSSEFVVGAQVTQARRCALLTFECRTRTCVKCRLEDDIRL